jgi:hypothetical protein
MFNEKLLPHIACSFKTNMVLKRGFFNLWPVTLFWSPEVECVLHSGTGRSVLLW